MRCDDEDDEDDLHCRDAAALAAVAAAEQSLTVVRGWIDSSGAQSGGTRGYRLKVSRDLLRGCAAVRAIIGDRGAPRPASRVSAGGSLAYAVCGRAVLLDHPAVAEIGVRAGYLPAGSTGTTALPELFKAARRFPGPVVRRPRVGSRFIAPEPLSRIDRVDVLLCVIAASGLPNALALVGSAMTMVGHVLRDAPLLRRVLDEVPVGEGWARRALVVALGLLGEPLPLEVAVADPREPLDVEACIFAATLVSPEAGAEVAASIYSAALDPSVAEVADEALARLEAGDYVGVVG